jgi:hypothetical protein
MTQKPLIESPVVDVLKKQLTIQLPTVNSHPTCGKFKYSTNEFENPCPFLYQHSVAGLKQTQPLCLAASLPPTVGSELPDDQFNYVWPSEKCIVLQDSFLYHYTRLSIFGNHAQFFNTRENILHGEPNAVFIKRHTFDLRELNRLIKLSQVVYIEDKYVGRDIPVGYSFSASLEELVWVYPEMVDNKNP